MHFLQTVLRNDCSIRNVSETKMTIEQRMMMQISLQQITRMLHLLLSLLLVLPPVLFRYRSVWRLRWLNMPTLKILFSSLWIY